MTKTRNNHYVPQWYQAGFFVDGRNTLAYLDKYPKQRTLRDGRVVSERALYDAPTSRAFRHRDLYSTFFGTSVNDEIERYLFGDIDGRGSTAVRAFTSADVTEWHRHFRTLFEYIDIQKIRTPKGLDWLKAQYPELTQNELMVEMQGIRMMHCTIWANGVREIVSAENADIKFIVSDHPVTIYNNGAPPSSSITAYPYDPGIALKGSQTIFPLNQNFCLILSNLEYARDPLTNPLEKRTFARNFAYTMTRTDAFIRTRELSNDQVMHVNRVIKARARRYVAAGRSEWLYPEQGAPQDWYELRSTFLPPERELWHFGGELFAKFEDGHVHYQDEFGRTEKEREFLKKVPPTKRLKSNDMCGCGNGRTFATCCMSKPASLRPTWEQKSIRERNIMMRNVIVNVLGLHEQKDWIQVRRDLTDEQISQVYSLYEGLWPLETDLLQLLPKPDGCARAVYTGAIHPSAITEFALGASLYFGELIVENPFLHAGTVKKKYSPVENPRMYRQEFVKTVVFFLTVMPLVELGLVLLVPDPGNFDSHLREQVMRMAEARSFGMDTDVSKERLFEKLMKEDFQRDLMLLPDDVLRRKFREASPELDDEKLDKVLRYSRDMNERDPLSVLQEDSLAGGENGGQFRLMKLAPNFEMAMYLAQATGSSIVTDSTSRWKEIQRATRRGLNEAPVLAALANNIGSSTFLFPQNVEHIAALSSAGLFGAYPTLMRHGFDYIANVRFRGTKANREAHLNSRFVKAHAPAQAVIEKHRIDTNSARISCIFSPEGIRDNTVNRLLLMANSESHLASVPMAFFVANRV